MCLRKDEGQKGQKGQKGAYAKETERNSRKRTHNAFGGLYGCSRGVDARPETAITVGIRGCDGNQSNIRFDYLAIEQLRDFTQKDGDVIGAS